jgi:hypothetical protein
MPETFHRRGELWLTCGPADLVEVGAEVETNGEVLRRPINRCLQCDLG